MAFNSKTRSWLLLGGVVCSVVCAQSPPAKHLSVPRDYTVDPSVHPDEIDRGPRRIVSMAPSITEMCAALGAADRIVGRTPFCVHPPSVASAQVVGGYADANFEKIIALKPQLVLITSSSPRLEEGLRAVGLRYETLPDSTLEDVYAAAEKLGRLLDRPRTAQVLVDALKSDLSEMSKLAGDHKNVRVLMTHQPLPMAAESIYIAGPGGYLDSLLRLAGYSNALQGLVDRAWAQVSLEGIIAADPDFILEVRTPDQLVNMQELYDGWSALSTVKAFQKRQIRSVGNPAASVPGPRVNLVLYDIITALSS